jgi:translation initiation factor 3 subunit A
MDTDKLVQLQVEQMDREKRELNERMRIVAKRLDHIERAFRKAELPLLADDYARQQTDDKVAFEATRQQTLEAARQAHQDRIATKKRLARMTSDYKKYIADIQEKRETDHHRRQEDASSKIAQEKAKRREVVLKDRAEEAAREEAEERARREKEEALARAEEGIYTTSDTTSTNPFQLTDGFAERRAEEARKAAEAEAILAAEEEKKKAEEEKAAEIRKQREQERAEAAKTAEMRMKREQEAEDRRRQRALDASKPLAAASASGSGDGWRKGTPRQELTPTASPRTGSGPLPPVSASPARYVPPQRAAVDVGGPPAKPGGWRESRLREQAANGSGSGRNSPISGSPALGRNSPGPRTDADGFQPAAKPKSSQGVYRPPGARGQNR